MSERWKRTREGYTDLGTSLSRHLQVPVGLTDRADGTVYYLFASNSGGVDRLGWSTVPPAGGLVTPRVFPVGEEPLLDGEQVRVFVRGGRMGFEDAATAHIYSNRRIMAHHLTQWFVTRFELILPEGRPPAPEDPDLPDRLAFETAPEW